MIHKTLLLMIFLQLTEHLFETNGRNGLDLVSFNIQVSTVSYKLFSFSSI